MSRRKGWANLSPSYRSRLQRAGITQSDYEGGGSLREARGHGDYGSLFDDWRDRVTMWYGASDEAVDEVMETHSRPQLARAIRLQQEVEDQYYYGSENRARQLWEMRDTSLPDWMFYYHAYHG